MKKVVISLVVLFLLLFLGLGAAAVYLLLPQLTQTEGQISSEPLTSSSQKTTIGVKKNAVTQADVLEALEYEYSQNQDTVGWLKISNTDINNSVLQSHNNITYLNLTERRQEDIFGAYFVDYECSVGARDELSNNIVIYGHSDISGTEDNPDGKRFSQLFRFTDPEFARENPYIEFSTRENFMDWQIFAVFYPEATMDYIGANYTGEELVALADTAKAMSLYDYGVEVGPEDTILTLSTCTLKFGKGDHSHRFVIMAKLLPEGTELADTADLTVKAPSE